ncbi:MAG: hypothetical protein MJY91_04140 [Bacteroidales bacterium]|nr:hypothetical protein [Bacteroidales bacterium]
MRRYLYILTLLAVAAGCCPTRIVTESSHVGRTSAYYTTVTVPRTHTVTTTTRVVAASEDISLYLDLQAVGAAFAQSNTIEEFENLLNNDSFMLSNLDLNNDGYVDYLRVMETVEGRNHVFVIQAVLAANIYQDVATLVCEYNSPSKAYVQIIGAPYIYGPNFIVEPVFYATPAIFIHFGRPHYNPWRSPWCWDHWPHHYHHPVPLYLSHYHAYVRTYMHNHHYCHEFRYATACHYPGYQRVAQPMMRNDYGQQHPERSFTVRNANVASATSGRAANARDIRESYEASSVTRSGSTRGGSVTGRGAASSSSSSRSAATSGSSASRSAATSSSSASRSAATSSASRSAASGSSSRSAATSGSSASRSAATSSSSASRSAATSSATRSAASGSSSRSATTSSSSTGSASRSTANSSTPRASSSQTTVRSRVSDSGASETTVRTTSSSGSTSTTRRGSAASSTSSTSSTSSSRSAATSSSSASRSSSAGSASRSTSASSTSRSAGSSSSSRSASSSSSRR